MAKYVIEIEDVPFGRNDDPVIPHGMDELYRAKGFKSLVFDQNGLDKLTPYTEPDRKDIEDEVWELVKKIECLTVGETEDCFDVEYDGIPFVANMFSYQEAKAKYEAWKKQKEAIHIGDEVKSKETEWGGVVTNVDQNGDLIIMDNSGETGRYYKAKHFEKTGRHFTEIEELLKKMK